MRSASMGKFIQQKWIQTPSPQERTSVLRLLEALPLMEQFATFTTISTRVCR